MCSRAQKQFLSLCIVGIRDLKNPFTPEVAVAVILKENFQEKK